MKKMSLNNTGSTQSGDLNGRLIAVMEKVHSYFFNHGMITSGLYDCAFVDVAVSLAKRAVEAGNPEAERIVSELENTNFIVYGDDNKHFANAKDNKVKTEFATEVVMPLKAAYLRSKEVQELYPSVGTMLDFIIREWCEE